MEHDISLFVVILWVIACAGLLAMLPKLVRTIPDSERNFLASLVAAASLVRLLVPFGPRNWYLGVEGVKAATDLFTRPTDQLPLLNELVIFDWGLGGDGIRGLNLVIGTACVPLLWLVAYRTDHSLRICRLFACLVAFTPAYVRYSALDASQMMTLFLFAGAALAYAEFAANPRDWRAALVLFATVSLGVPVRLESAPLFLVLPLFAYHGEVRLRAQIWRAPTLVLLAAMAVGGSSLLASHGESLAIHGQKADLGMLVLVLVSRLTCVVSPHPVSFFPPLIALPIWILVVRLLRRRDWQGLAHIYLPIFACAVPALFSGGVFLDLPGAGYYLIALLFVLLAAAVGLDAIWPALARRPIARWGLALLALVATLPPYWRTYAYQEEYGFLARSLPHEPATILVIWDPKVDANDFDCCLALPYPTLQVEFPELRWIVLSRAAYEVGRKDELIFDYYYPGSMVGIDLASLDSPYAKLVQPKPELRAKQREHIEALRAIDADIHARYLLEPEVSAQVVAHTFSSVAFADNQVELVIYRRRTL